MPFEFRDFNTLSMFYKRQSIRDGRPNFGKIRDRASGLALSDT